GCVANFWEIKDQITLIKAVEMLLSNGENILLRLIGSGPTLQSCKDYVQLKNLNQFISFEKEIRHELLNTFINKIDLFVLPSYYEALGCVYLESWATNTPFIAVRNQGISELIPDDMKDNFLVSKSDELNLSKSILDFKNNTVLFPFDEKYNIKNTISNFLKNQVFDE
ncbi:MAG: hypothetical protein CMP60_04070, partial [Flavobacteriales bacterium]|nr:hypothetical protein [Flavobacteriales bacterium]